MEFRDVVRTTHAVRDFTTTPLSDRTLAEILDDARFAPSGGNRQAWRTIIVKDLVLREQLRDVYALGWNAYVAQTLNGMTPFSPLNDRDQEAAVIADYTAAREGRNPREGLDFLVTAPALVVVLADLGQVAAMDRDLTRYSLVGGGSVYPFCWSILLSARSRGFGGVLTTMATLNESAVCELLAIPPTHALAGLIALGEPQRQFTRLTRSPVENFTTVNTFDGEAFGLSGHSEAKDD